MSRNQHAEFVTLNEDDALEHFKATLPSASLMQVQRGTAVVTKRDRELDWSGCTGLAQRRDTSRVSVVTSLGRQARGGMETQTLIFFCVVLLDFGQQKTFVSREKFFVSQNKHHLRGTLYPKKKHFVPRKKWPHEGRRRVHQEGTLLEVEHVQGTSHR